MNIKKLKCILGSACTAILFACSASTGNASFFSPLTVYAEEAVTAEQQEWNEPELRDTETKQVSWLYGILHSNSNSISTASDSGDSEDTELDLLQKYSDKIKDALLAGETQISLSDLSITSDNKQFKHLGYYCPYLDGTHTNIVLYIYSDGDYAYIQITNTLSTEETKNWIDKIDSKLAELKQLISDTNLSEADKALILHDYMDAHYHYDTTYADYYPSIMLTNKDGVCQSYAYLFQYLMNEEGYDCYTTTTTKHAWNILKIGSDYYHIDITWDDPTNDLYGEAQHDYFLLSDKTIENIGSTDHTDWDLTELKCNDTSYESAYFTSAKSPVVFNGSDRYYIDADGLEQYNVTDTEQSASLIDSVGKWYVFGSSNTYYTSKYSGLFLYDGKLYYNSSDSVKTYNLYTKQTATLSKIDTTSGYVYGLLCEGSTIAYEYAQAPSVTYSSKDIGTLSLPDAHTHSFGEYTVTKEATATEEGSKTRTCSECGDTETAVIPKISTIPHISISAAISTTSSSKITWTGSVNDYANQDLTNVKEHGIIYIATARLGSSASLTIDVKGRTKVKFGAYSATGTFKYTFRPSSKNTQYTAVTYLLVENADGSETYVYSDPITISYNGL